MRFSVKVDIISVPSFFLLRIAFSGGTFFYCIIFYMKKILSILLILLFLPNFVSGEELWPRGMGKPETKETHPIYFGYMEDYAELLREAFASKKMIKVLDFGVTYDYIVTRDGEIKEMKASLPHNPYHDRKIKEVILSVKPLPFREGMNLDYMRFSVSMFWDKYEMVYVFIGAYSQGPDDLFVLDITIPK